MGDEYKLVLSFPDQSPSFAHGFTCGRIWQQMSDDMDKIEMTCDADVRGTIEAMAMAKGWTEMIEDIDDDWILVTLVNPKLRAAR